MKYQSIPMVIKRVREDTLLKDGTVHLDEVVVYEKGKHFTEGQFREEFGDEVEYPMISIGMFRGTLKETLNHMNQKGHVGIIR